MHLIVKDKNKTGGDFLKVIKDSDRLDKLKNAGSIVIKPNFAGYADWNSHCITGLHLLEVIIKVVLEVNEKALIYIAESDSRYGRYAYLKFRKLNLPDCLAIDKGMAHRIQTLDLSRDRVVRSEDSKFIFFNGRNGYPDFSEKLINSGFLISLSNVKTHNICHYTGACKNLFGCLPGSEKEIFHGYVHKVVHDVNQVIRPDISVVDGFRGMQGNGPIEGDNADFGFMVISDDPAEADFTAAGLVGINPRKVKYLRLIINSSGRKDLIKIPDAIMNIKRPDASIRVKMRIKGLIAAAGYRILRHGL